MLCAIYKSKKQAGMYLYVTKRDSFDAVPEPLLKAFGTPQFVMLFNLAGNRPLARADKQTVRTQLEQNGFYLQLPPTEENLLEQFRAAKRESEAAGFV